MTSQYYLNAQKRDVFGKKLKSAQKELMPAVCYGKKSENQPVFVSLKEFQKIFKEAGETSVIELILDDGKKNVLIHDIQFNPLTGSPIHADFLTVEMDKLIEAEVGLEFTGESDAVKSLGGILVKVIHEVLVEALPSDLPHKLIIDISFLKNLDDKIIIADLVLPKGVKILKHLPEETVALIESKTEEKEIEEQIDFSKIEASAEKKKEEEIKEK